MTGALLLLPKMASHRHVYGVLTFIVFLAQAALAVEINNKLIGEPEVQCGSETVEMQFRTERPFEGKVFVKGHYSTPGCKVDYTNITASQRPTGGIAISHGACDMIRQRMISPDQGMQFSAVIVVSFHPTFITKIDRAFNVKCMYRELTKTVTAGLDVSMLTTETLAHSFPMPICTYSIRKDEIDGDVLRYARVGQQVVHRWECDSAVYGILVHSCTVEDGQGQKVEVIDAAGCHKDEYVLGDPTYIENLNMAYREAHVIKFADRVTVRFQCQIRLCMKADDGCKGITPPICGIRGRLQQLVTNTTSAPANSSEILTEPSTEPTRPVAGPVVSRRFFRNKRSNTHAPSTHTTDDFAPVDGDFQSQTLYVLDTVENPEKGTVAEERALETFLVRRGSFVASNANTGDVCLSVPAFAILMTAVTCVFLAAAFATAVMCCRKLHLSSGAKVADFDDSPPASTCNGSKLLAKFLSTA